jgi:S-adenosylmethionine:tRNA ribosyltransferase-isomerase
LLRTDFEFHLPERLIAQQALDRRDASRMLVLDRTTGQWTHAVFSRLPEFLRGDELILVNNSRVMPARVFARKESGGRVELLALRVTHPRRFEAMTRTSKPLRPGQQLVSERGSGRLVVVEIPEPGRAVVETDADTSAMELIHAAGKMPLPPYIRREAEADDGGDRERYQTVYADPIGSVAAPTAGLHFTPEVLDAVRGKGCEIAQVTLHVGPGTFLPVRVDRIEEHRMEEEHYEISRETADAIARAKAEGRPVLAVGTTTVRTIETAAAADGTVPPGPGSSRLFIYPGYRFKVVDAMVTNFHLPGSTLIMLVSALAGRESILAAYEEAVREEYRFYSYGDCMLIRSFQSLLKQGPLRS